MQHRYFLLRPPYGDGSIVQCHTVPSDSSIPRGGIVALRPDRGMIGEAILAIAADTASRIARAPIVLWSTELGVDALVHLAEHAVAAGIRSFITHETIDADKLRNGLCSRDWTSAHVIHWLRRRGLRVEPPLADVVAMSMSAEKPVVNLAAALESCRHGYHAWSRATQAAGFKRSEDAFQVLRVLRACIEVQAHPQEPLPELADSLGYCAEAALRSRLRDVIGTTVTEVRLHLSWEWLLHQALRRAAIRMPRGD